MISTCLNHDSPFAFGANFRSYEKHETSQLLDLNLTLARSNGRYSAEVDGCGSGLITSLVHHDVEIVQDHSFVILHSCFLKKSSTAERRQFSAVYYRKHMDQDPREAVLRK